VRKEELRKFRDGDTDIIVTTDCIGMGMNVNVERVVFLSSSKFDGQDNRPLNISEVKQIAGRAGRMGMFDKGYVNALEDRDDIEYCLYDNYSPILKARLGFPETLVNIDETLTDTFIIWSKIQDQGIFVKTDMQRSILLCRYLERFNFDKVQMLKFINIPFDEKNNTLLYLWQSLIQQFSQGKIDIESKVKYIGKSQDLFDLELDYKKLDLIFSFLKSIDAQEADYFKLVTELKEAISLKLIKELKKRKNTFKSCKICGKKLAWNYEYGMCKKCFEKQKRRYYYDDYYYHW
jgi:ATP-dependent RNA helicase SUPV3L1/SUV3